MTTRKEDQVQAGKKVAIVTGAGSGIGGAASLALLRDGWSVVLCGRRAALLSEVAEASDAGARALAVPADVTDPQSVRALFDRAMEVFGAAWTCCSTMPASARQPCRWRTCPSSSGSRWWTST